MSKKLRIALPILALAALFMFITPPHANAKVHFGVYVGPPVYAYPAYPYAYSYPSPNSYYAPAYPSYGYGYSYPGYYGGYFRDSRHDRHEYYEHRNREYREHRFRNDYRR